MWYAEKCSIVPFFGLNWNLHTFFPWISIKIKEEISIDFTIFSYWNGFRSFCKWRCPFSTKRSGRYRHGNLLNKTTTHIMLSFFLSKLHVCHNIILSLTHSHIYTTAATKISTLLLWHGFIWMLMVSGKIGQIGCADRMYLRIYSLLCIWQQQMRVMWLVLHCSLIRILFWVEILSRQH